LTPGQRRPAFPVNVNPDEARAALGDGLLAMELKLYDTLTREKRVFAPIDPQRVRMYVCGVTVYDFAHIGNARPAIVFDVLFRLLRHIYGAEHVKYVRNITDVDDKINARAAERGIAIRELTTETYGYYEADVAALGCLPPTVEPRATEHIDEMRVLIERLVASKHAYVEQDHVLFDVPSMTDYGMLSKRPLDEMIAGARVDVAPYKHGDMDFVLWKPSKPGEPSWPSPAGIATPGRPGWHIECSAMSWKHLGETFDIHGGGIDLVFPHHENEIAQSRCAFHTQVMANYWMHNGFLQVEGEKMSKSLGNFFTIRELLDKWPGDVLRLQMLMTHYRQPIDWTEGRAEVARMELEEWANVISMYANLPDAPIPPEVIEALSDDLNTPNAITVLRELFSKAKNAAHEPVLKFAAGCRFLGFQNLKRPGVFRFGVSGMNTGLRLFDFEDDVVRLRAAIANDAPTSAREAIIAKIRGKGLAVTINKHSDVMLVPLDHDEDAFEAKIDFLITARASARKDKNFAESDRIRDELLAMGVVLKDSKDGTTWEIAR
jgi:cysteinyl-tRNA synthetase